MTVFSALRTSVNRGGCLNIRSSILAHRSSAQWHRSFSATPKKTDKEDEANKVEPTAPNAEEPKQPSDDYTGKFYQTLPISFADISRAEVAIRGGVKRTVCEHSPFISELVGANVYFKPEFRQYTGSFKERGARNAILQLMREKKDKLRGVVAAR